MRASERQHTTEKDKLISAEPNRAHRSPICALCLSLSAFEHYSANEIETKFKFLENCGFVHYYRPFYLHRSVIFLFIFFIIIIPLCVWVFSAWAFISLNVLVPVATKSNENFSAFSCEFSAARREE